MRLFRFSGRRIEKQQGREMSMTGWDKLLKDEAHKTKAADRQRHISMGLGHHLARMMKGHI